MPKVHLTFQVDVLKRCTPSGDEIQHNTAPALEVEDPYEYKAKYIIDEHEMGRRKRYWIRWPGYDKMHDSWPIAEKLQNALEVP